MFDNLLSFVFFGFESLSFVVLLCPVVVVVLLVDVFALMGFVGEDPLVIASDVGLSPWLLLLGVLVVLGLSSLVDCCQCCRVLR